MFLHIHINYYILESTWYIQLSHGADPNVHGRDGLTPLMKACRYKDKGVKAAQILLDHGADVNQLAMPKKDMRTALHYAVLSGSESMTEFLIKVGFLLVYKRWCGWYAQFIFQFFG